jgi:hypothetical protein
MRVWVCSSMVALYFTKKSLTQTGWCAGAWSWSRNILLVLHFSGRFLLAASLRRRKLSMCISLFTIAIPVNYASEFREILETTTYNWERRIQCVLSLEMMPEIDYDCSFQTPYLTRSGYERQGSGGSRHQDERTHWLSVAEYAGLGQFNL